MEPYGELSPAPDPGAQHELGQGSPENPAALEGVSNSPVLDDVVEAELVDEGVGWQPPSGAREDDVVDAEIVDNPQTDEKARRPTIDELDTRLAGAQEAVRQHQFEGKNYKALIGATESVRSLQADIRQEFATQLNEQADAARNAANDQERNAAANSAGKLLGDLARRQEWGPVGFWRDILTQTAFADWCEGAGLQPPDPRLLDRPAEDIIGDIDRRIAEVWKYARNNGRGEKAAEQIHLLQSLRNRVEIARQHQENVRASQPPEDADPIGVSRVGPVGKSRENAYEKLAAGEEPDTVETVFGLGDANIINVPLAAGIVAARGVRRIARRGRNNRDR